MSSSQKNINTLQLSDGSFSGSEATFLTSLILTCLNNLESTPQLDNIKRQALDFLLNQKSAFWSFNYWKRDSKKNKSLPYPDDLDDTFCALAAINGFDDRLLDGEALAKITTILTAVEENEGGPYRTWIVPSDSETGWKDVDIAVNSNIAFFLAMQGIFLPKVRRFLVDRVIKKELDSPYYPTIFPIVYFLSRYFKLDRKITSSQKQILQKIILSKQNSHRHFGNPLHTALAVSALINLDIDPQKLAASIKHLRRTCRNGVWPRYPFCCDPVIKKRRYYAGSVALTTAFCLEALTMYHQKIKTIIPKTEKKDLQAEKLYYTVIKKAEERFSKLGTELQSIASTVLSETIKKDLDKQVILLPYYFCQSLGQEGKSIGRDFLVTLGLANLYGWIAYRIYDDFFDSEGNSLRLSLANICLRELTVIYQDLIPAQYRDIMNKMDSANAWEIAHTRFDPQKYPPQSIPDYDNLSQLAYKSFGHALGPIAILIRLGYGFKSPKVNKFLTFFRHYIIARQLNDDAHDWENDMNHGQINAVGAMILSRITQKSDMQKIFWEEIYECVAQIIYRHTNIAKKAWPSLSFLIILIESSLQNGLTERQKSLNFLNTYQSIV